MLKRWGWGLGLGVAGALFAATPAMAAGSGYGPAGPVSTSVPGGYKSVVMTESLQPSTTSQTVSVTVLSAVIQLIIPGGTFAQPVQLVITAPNLTNIATSLPALHLAGYQAIAGIGVAIDASNGKPLAGTFGHPVSVTVHNSAIRSGDKVGAWNRFGIFSMVANTSAQSGVATWAFSSDPAFVILAPPRKVQQATSPVTGKPFAAVGALGVIAVGAGLVLLRQSAKNSA